MKNSSPRLQKFKAFLGSAKFFWVIVALLVVQAVWLACSALYPMAFDEDFHLGLIKLYAHHISPFWDAHPAGGDAFGALTRDPSYLFHYLMSFPYRLISAFTSNQTAQVIILRLMNVAFVAVGLVMYRKLLLKVKAPSMYVNLALFILVMVPIFPYLAAQINYDNLLLPLIGWSLLLALRLRNSFKNNSLDARALLLLTTLLFTGSLIKYAFIPILIGVVAYLLYHAYQVYKTPSKLWVAISGGCKKLSKPALIGLMLLSLLSAGLFAERYGWNVIKYHDPLVDCGAVLDFDHCKSYGPWIRDYYLEQNKGNPDLNVLAFNNDWFQGMWFRSFFAISGATNGFQNHGPLTLPALGTVFFAALGVAAFIYRGKAVFRRYNSPVLWLLLCTGIVYVGMLWLLNYQMYNRTGKAVAINGRYLLPVVPVAVLLTALALNEALKARTWLKITIGTVVIICYIWGGGALTWILRSHDSWYWPNGALNGTNRFIQRNVGPLTPGYRQPEQYMP